MSSAAKLKQALLTKRAKPALSKENAISTGSTLLNLACTDHPAYGFRKGGYYYLVGDSTSGKTWLSLSCFAEAASNPAFKDYRFIFDDVEGGALMNVEHYFGKEVARRMTLPAVVDGIPVCSDTVEDFYYNITDALKVGKPFIYVLDSQDALDSHAAGEKFEKRKEAHRKGVDSAGSYGDGKAKIHSENIRHVLSGLRKTGSILIIIGQTRDNLGMGFEQKTRAGGRALRFYANLEIWTSLALKIKKSVRGKDRTIGVNCQAEVKKNRVTGKVGKDRIVKIPIYYDYGIDDIGSCVDYLVAEKHWKKNGQRIEADELLFTGLRTKLIQYIEEEGLEHQVRKITGKLWRTIEEECHLPRKKRYE